MVTRVVDIQEEVILAAVIQVVDTLEEVTLGAVTPELVIPALLAATPAVAIPNTEQVVVIPNRVVTTQDHLVNTADTLNDPNSQLALL